MKRLITILLCLFSLCSCTGSIEVGDGRHTGESFIADYGSADGENYDTVFIGDSITVGLYDAADLGGARVLAKVGITTTGMYARLSEYYGDIIDENVKTAVINLGTNDVDTDTTEVYRRLISFIKEKAPDAQIYVCLIHYPYEGSVYAEYNNKAATDEKNRQLGTLKGFEGARLSDCLQKSPLKDTLTDPALTQEDGLHLTDEAYRMWCMELKKDKIIK